MPTESPLSRRNFLVASGVAATTVAFSASSWRYRSIVELKLAMYICSISGVSLLNDSGRNGPALGTMRNTVARIFERTPGFL